jgi:hypothetical protein
MADEIRTGASTRRYVRVRGPFDGYYRGESDAPVLIYDLNLGGGFVNFSDAWPDGATLRLNIDLMREGPIHVTAEAIYREGNGIAVRFVDLDADSAARLKRAIESLAERCML